MALINMVNNRGKSRGRFGEVQLAPSRDFSLRKISEKSIFRQVVFALLLFYHVTQ